MRSVCHASRAKEEARLGLDVHTGKKEGDILLQLLRSDKARGNGVREVQQGCRRQAKRSSSKDGVVKMPVNESEHARLIQENEELRRRLLSLISHIPFVLKLAEPTNTSAGGKWEGSLQSVRVQAERDRQFCMEIVKRNRERRQIRRSIRRRKCPSD